MAKVNKTKYALLGVLNLVSGSGYDIKKFCDSSIGYFWNENYGHIYPVLQKMEEEGLITKEVKQTEGRPSKNVYSITQLGREELEKWVMSPVEVDPIRSEFLLKIFLSKDIPMQNVIEKIETLKADCERELQEYSKIEGYFNSGRNDISKKEAMLYLSTVRYGKLGEEARLRWCEETLKAFKEKEIENLSDV